MFVPRPYQIEARNAILDELLKEYTALCVGSTGLGKTEIMFMTINAIPNHRKVCILVNKVKLLKQTYNRAKKALSEKTVKIFCGSLGQYDLDAQVIIASIQSISKMPNDFDYIILDECHGVNQSEGRYVEFLNKNPKVKIVALTATPYRADGYIYGKGKLFKRICYQKGLLWSIENKFLVPPRIKYTDEQFDVSGLTIQNGDYKQGELNILTNDAEKLNKQLDDALPKLKGRNKVVWSCSSIRHATDVCNELINRGELAIVVHSQLDRELHDTNFELFEKNNYRHLVFVTECAEGWDYPPVDAIVLMRPTRSPVLMVQIIGRGLRNYEGKTDCLVLDYGKVIENCGPVDSPFIKEGKGKKSAITIKMKFCPNCYEYMTSQLMTCPCCEYEFPAHRESDYQKNLTDKAANVDILSTPKEVKIHKVSFKIHKSKAGNECFKITYHGPILNIDEYIVTRLEWRIRKRLKDIFDQFIYENQVIDKEFKVDLTVETRKEGKYERIVNVKRNRDSDEYLGLSEWERRFLFSGE